MSTAREYAWLNGKIVAREDAAPSVASSNLHLGTSVFEGIMAYWNGADHLLHAVEPHLERFRAGTARMRLPIAFDEKQLEDGIRELLGMVGEDDHYIRPLALRRAPELYDVRNLDAPADVLILAVTADRDVNRPMRCCLSSWRRVSSSAIPVSWKVSGAYANSMIAQYDAYERGYDTAIMLDGRGRISEACTANLFFIDGDALVTPALDADVFPGITRSLLLDRASALEIDVTQRDIYPEEIPRFDGAFICATLLEVRAVSTIDAHQYTVSHPVFLRMLDEFRRITHGHSTMAGPIN